MAGPSPRAPPNTLVGVPEVSSSEIDDPPLEGVPILPIEAAAQALAEVIETIRKEGLTPDIMAGAAIGAVTRKLEKVLPVDKILKRKAAQKKKSDDYVRV